MTLNTLNLGNFVTIVYEGHAGFLVAAVLVSSRVCLGGVGVCLSPNPAVGIHPFFGGLALATAPMPLEGHRFGSAVTRLGLQALEFGGLGLKISKSCKPSKG